MLTYDPTNNKWCEVAPMATPRVSFALIAFKDCLYAVGGSYGNMDLKTSILIRTNHNIYYYNCEFKILF